MSGEVLGPAIAENTCIKELDLSWNCIRRKGAIAIAQGIKVGHRVAMESALSSLVGKPTKWFPTRSDINRPVQSQKRAKISKFRIEVEEELYYPSSENKGADQLRSYCEADLPLCFCLGRLLVFPCGGSVSSLHDNLSRPCLYSHLFYLFGSGLHCRRGLGSLDNTLVTSAILAQTQVKACGRVVFTYPS